MPRLARRAAQWRELRQALIVRAIVPTSDIGWSPQRDAQLQDFLRRWPQAYPARVARVESAVATVWANEGPVLVRLPSKLRHVDTRPAVGDWAVVRPGAPPTLAALLPRRTEFVRRAAGRKVAKQVVAANADLVFVVSSLDGDFNPRRLERYLTAVRDGGARPVVLLTKAAGCPDVDAQVRAAQDAVPDVSVHAMDVIDGVAPDAADRYLGTGTTAALVGSSGVGKSTLLNHWLGEARQQTRAVRASDNKGVHTTTARELFIVRQGGLVIDTPGMRELALWADADALDDAFADIDTLAATCRFSDCRHDTEPGCAVQAAVDDGALDPARLASYINLRHEVERTTAELPAYERRRRDRVMGRVYKEAQRWRRRSR